MPSSTIASIKKKKNIRNRFGILMHWWKALHAKREPDLRCILCMPGAIKKDLLSRERARESCFSLTFPLLFCFLFFCYSPFFCLNEDTKISSIQQGLSPWFWGDWWVFNTLRHRYILTGASSSLALSRMTDNASWPKLCIFVGVLADFLRYNGTPGSNAIRCSVQFGTAWRGLFCLRSSA
jgi:hypothetical protein